jgi:hypothetical protein
MSRKSHASLEYDLRMTLMSSILAKKRQLRKGLVMNLEEMPPDCIITKKMICDDLNRSFRTIGRWQEDPDIEFPKPALIRRRHYWKLRDYLTWKDRMLGLISGK